MWTEQRKDIESIRYEHKIAESDFKPLDYSTNWKVLEENIHRSFCKITHSTARPLWLWNSLKNESYSVATDVYPHLLLNELVDNNETVWFMVNDMVGSYDKFWFYEGKIKAIQIIISESTYLDEYYLISKKYEWILCVNHHDILIGSGQKIIENLRQLKSSITPTLPPASNAATATP